MMPLLKLRIPPEMRLPKLKIQQKAPLIKRKVHKILQKASQAVMAVDQQMLLAV